MNKRMARLACIFLAILIPISACVISSKVPSTVEPTKKAFYATAMRELSLSETANAISENLELTKVYAEIESSPGPTSSINSENWVEAWLRSPTCQPPCWEHITPGQTTLHDAMKVIAQIPGTKFDWVSLQPDIIEKTSFVTWKFDSTGSGQIETKEDSEIIASIDLFLSDDQELAIQEVIEAYGHPSVLIRTDCLGEFFSPRKCGYALLYKEKGVSLYIDVISMDDDPVDITPDIRVKGITLSTLDNMEVGGVDYRRANQQAWEGFKTYTFQKKQQ